MKHVIFVIGDTTAGKSTVGQMFSDALNCHLIDTGKVVARHFKQLTGMDVTPAWKEELRPHLVQLANLMRLIDQARLMKMEVDKIFEPMGWLVVVGVRMQAEYDACLEYCDQHDSEIFTVYVAKGFGGEPPRDNMELSQGDARHVIVNDGSVDKLQQNVARLIAEWLLK